MDTTLARRIHAAAHLTGEFVLRSGAVSSEYFDKYRFEADPALLADVTTALTDLVPPGVDAVAGLELGGIPLATMLSQRTGLPARFVRKQPKPYGTRRLAEGGDVDGLRLLVVEDVVTSGGQLVDSCRQLAARGAEVVRAVCVVDRQAGGGEALAAAGVELAPLFTAAALRAATGPADGPH
jgi:orotate phosphoribosyltransferase